MSRHPVAEEAEDMVRLRIGCSVGQKPPLTPISGSKGPRSAVVCAASAALLMLSKLLLLPLLLD